MPTFKYTAIDLTGKKIKGILSSASERAARQQIKAGNLTPLSLELSVNRFKRKLRVSQKDVLFATRQIATLLDSGIALDETLKSIADEVDDKNLSAALHSVRDEVLQGSRIADAMSSHSTIFNETYRSLIAAGDAAGNLHIAFSNLADYLEENETMTTICSFAPVSSFPMTNRTCNIHGSLLLQEFQALVPS